MLSTPPAFILSQDQTLVKSVCIQFKITASNFVPVYCSGLTSFDVRSWKISLKNFQGLLSIVQLSMFFFVVAVSCDSFYIISKCFMFVNNFFISFLLLWSSSSRDSFNRIPYPSKLVNSFFLCPLCDPCMPLLSLCLDQRTNVILPRLPWIVNVVFIFCAIQNILIIHSSSSDTRLGRRIFHLHKKTAVPQRHSCPHF